MAWKTLWERVFNDEEGERHYYVMRTTDVKEAEEALYVECGGAVSDEGAEFAEQHFGEKRPKYFYRTANNGLFTTKRDALAFEKETMRDLEGIGRKLKAKTAKAGGR